MEHKCELLNNFPTDPSIQRDDELRVTIRKMLDCDECLLLQLDSCKIKYVTALHNKDIVKLTEVVEKVHTIVKMLDKVKNYLIQCSDEVIKRAPKFLGVTEKAATDMLEQSKQLYDIARNAALN